MGDKTGIEWCDSTWNPVRGCTRVSEGCRNCYAEGVAARFSGPGQPFYGFADRARTGSKWTGQMALVGTMLDLPLRWRTPRRIFVNSMSDLFHEGLPAEEIATIFAIAVAAVHLRGHTFQILTKRAARMREVLNSVAFWDQVNAEAGALVMNGTDPQNRRSDDARATCGEYGPDKPPPGIWLGVSVENQAAADARIPELLQTPAALRFLSCEPLLGPVSLSPMDMPGGWTALEPLYRIEEGEMCDGDGDPIPGSRGRIDWVIAGGESGPDARPMHPDWVRGLRDECAEAGVPYFFKQWGAWATFYDRDREDPDWRRCPRCDAPGKRYLNLAGGHGFHGERVVAVRRASKAATGATLDGCEHKEFPA